MSTSAARGHNPNLSEQELAQMPVYPAPSFPARILSTDVHDGIPTGVWSMGAPLFWKRQVTGKGVKVGIIDSGIDDTHPDLRGKVVKRVDYVKDKDSNGNLIPPSKFGSHGTHVAGIIAANGTIKGVAPDAQLYDYRVFPAAEGGATNESITSAIFQGIQDGVHILNLSLGGPYDYPPMHEAIKQAVAKGILVVVAAGNKYDFQRPPFIDYPAFYHEVISVAAVDFNVSARRPEDLIENLWWSYENKEVDVCADGYQVYSTIPTGRVASGVPPYASYNGTSMACPHIAGFCALLVQDLKEQRPDIVLGTANSENEIFKLLKYRYSVDVHVRGWDEQTGFGYVTCYPVLPFKDVSGRWTLPGLEIGQPAA